MLTSPDLAARTDRAVAAAADAGRDLGLTGTEPRVLYDVFSVVVHLSSAPMMVRVPTVLPRTVAADPDAPKVSGSCSTTGGRRRLGGLVESGSP
jgi:hypothetical protein